MIERAYAIGDVHGQLDELARAHERIRADRLRVGDLESPVIHLGDLVDRGPESAEVVEYLSMGPAWAGPWVILKGNHDFMFGHFLTAADPHDPGLRADLTWLDPRLGGDKTLASYGVEVAGERPLGEVWVEAKARVPAAHLAFIDGLPLMYRHDEAAYVHAGIRPGVPLDRQSPQDLMWIRQPFLDDRRDHGLLIVHGHTALDAPHLYGNRLNLDSGAGYGRPLTAAVIEGREAWVLTDDGRMPLPSDTRLG